MTLVFLKTLKKEKEGNKNYGQRLSLLIRIRTHFSNDQETYFTSIKPNENRVSIIVCPLTIIRNYLFIVLYNTIVAIFMYCRLISANIFYFINKLLFLPVYKKWVTCNNAMPMQYKIIY